MLDMDFAIAVYIDAGRRDRRSILERLAGDFEKTIGGVVNIVASAATELQAAAQTMTASAKDAANAVVGGGRGLEGRIVQRSVGRRGDRATDRINSRNIPTGE